MDDTAFSQGDRVRLVHGFRCGSVLTGEVFPSPTFGTPRIHIMWDANGIVSAWNPAFLRPADTKPEDDPERVEDDHTIMERGWTTSKVTGIRHKRDSAR